LALPARCAMAQRTLPATLRIHLGAKLCARVTGHRKDNASRNPRRWLIVLM